ncbi:MAG: DNA methyltransferase [Chitinophagales bacterium]
MNKLILGDNLEILKNMDSESVDLIYLDPPFFSNRTYEVIWGDKGEVRSFEDRFSGGIDHYIAWLKERVIEMHRILKPTGSIFLHCDWHANAYIRVDILDKIFGQNNFKGEIIWQRKKAQGDAKNRLATFNDTIWYYSKSNSFTYHQQFIAHSDEYKDGFYKYDDNDGKGLYRLNDMSAPAGGGMSAINKKTGKPNGWYVYKDFQPPEKGWRYSYETMHKLDEEGLIYFPKNKNGSLDYSKRLYMKRYLNEQKGTLLGNIWTDINNVQANSEERIGYPTQKPQALLERIINMSSNEGDVVLDPFVGGGTTVAVADKLGRKWIGIDQSVQAVKVTELRLNNQQDLFSQPFMVQLHKYDYDTLRYKDAFEFEQFIVTAYGGRTNTKQRGDLGLDGRTLDNVPIQVKRSDNIGRNVIDNFHSAIQRYDKALYEKNKKDKKEVGYIIAFSFGKGAIEEVARLKNKEEVVIKLITVEEIIPIAKKPTLKVEVIDKGKDAKKLHELHFKATANSEAGIEFFSWDFDYDETKKQFKPEVLLDKTGEQSFKFKAGLHHIAVKVFDNDGLENTEIIKIKVNGKAEVV